MVKTAVSRAVPVTPIAIPVSHLPEAQEPAIAAGAQPGFGKGDLFGPTAADLIRACLGG
jgi:hypothetical protein